MEKEYIQFVNLLKTIRLMAVEKTIEEDENFEGVQDYIGSNVDDAYSLGREAGRVMFARELLKILGIEPASIASNKEGER